MLFPEYTYFDHKFPEPQYLGAKYSNLAWIKKFIPRNIKVALDSFAGSQSVAFLFKQMGLKTITNDFLSFNNKIGLALIENSNEKITQDDLNILFQPSKNKNEFNLLQSVFTNVFFLRKQKRFESNILALPNI